MNLSPFLAIAGAFVGGPVGAAAGFAVGTALTPKPKLAGFGHYGRFGLAKEGPVLAVADTRPSPLSAQGSASSSTAIMVSSSGPVLVDSRGFSSGVRPGVVTGRLLSPGQRAGIKSRGAASATTDVTTGDRPLPRPQREGPSVSVARPGTSETPPAVNTGASGTTKEGEVFVDDQPPAVIDPGTGKVVAPPAPGSDSMKDKTNMGLLLGVVVFGGAAMYLSRKGVRR